MYKTLLLAIGACLFVGAQACSAQTTNQTDSCSAYKTAQVPHYIVVKHWKTTLKPGLVLFVSIPPDQADRPRMVALSCELGRRYASEQSLYVVIFDSTKAAKLFNFSGEGNSNWMYAARKAIYGFTRGDNGTQSLDWAENPDRRNELIHIDLGPPPPAKP